MGDTDMKFLTFLNDEKGAEFAGLLGEFIKNTPNSHDRLDFEEKTGTWTLWFTMNSPFRGERKMDTIGNYYWRIKCNNVKIAEQKISARHLGGIVEITYYSDLLKQIISARGQVALSLLRNNLNNSNISDTSSSTSRTSTAGLLDLLNPNSLRMSHLSVSINNSAEQTPLPNSNSPQRPPHFLLDPNNRNNQKTYFENSEVNSLYHNNSVYSAESYPTVSVKPSVAYPDHAFSAMPPNYYGVSAGYNANLVNYAYPPRTEQRYPMPPNAGYYSGYPNYPVAPGIIPPLPPTYKKYRQSPKGASVWNPNNPNSPAFYVTNNHRTQINRQTVNVINPQPSVSNSKRW